MARSKRQRVFVLGAGVSATCGIAVARDLLRHSIQYLKAENHRSQTKIIHDLLKYFYPAFDYSLKNYPNIEDFLNLIEMAKKFNSEEFIESNLWPTPKLQRAMDDTIKGVTDYIWSLMGRRKQQQRLSEFVRHHLRPGDTVVTFNWDVTLEQSLRAEPSSPKFMYTYSRKSHAHIFLLKPHGSIDWFKRKDTHSLSTEKRKKLIKHDEQIYCYPEVRLDRLRELAEVAPVIVPPVSAKSFDEYPFLKKTWRNVFRAVSDATEIHFVGYSLPKEDQFARFVLRRAMRANILKAKLNNSELPKVVVTNPDLSVEQTFSSMVGRDVSRFRYNQALFEDLVANYKSLTA